MGNQHRSMYIAGLEAAAVAGDLLRMEEELGDQIDRLIASAFASGVSGPALSDLTGLSVAALRHRAERTVVEDVSARIRSSLKEGRKPSGDALPGITLADAVRQLDRTRKTVQEWAERGRIPAIVIDGVEQGRLRILPDEDGQIPVASDWGTWKLGGYDPQTANYTPPQRAE